MSDSKVFIIVATYDEADNIGRLIPEIFEAVPDAHLLIVDDNSPDGTADLVNELKATYRNLHLIKRAGKLGYGTAFVEGFRYALENEADMIVTMDADFSHDPKAIPELLNKIDGDDVVIGSRYVNGIRILNWPIRRLILSVCANIYVRTILRLGITDCTSGFRCYKADVLRELDLDHLTSHGYAFLVELLFNAHRNGSQISEHPIIYTERRDGQSKMSKTLIIESFIRPIQMQLSRLVSRSRK